MTLFLKQNWYFVVMAVLSGLDSLLQFAVGNTASGLVWLASTAVWSLVLIMRYRRSVKK